MMTDVERANDMLFQAVAEHDISGVLRAMDNGAQISATNFFHRNALFVAALNGCLYPTTELGLLLKVLGVNVNEQDTHGMNALAYLSHAGQLAPELAEYMAQTLGISVLARDELGFDVFLAAAKSGILTVELARVLADAGADVNAADNEGKNALSHLALNGCATMELVRELVDLGCDINHTDRDGQIPLLLSIQESMFNDRKIKSLYSCFSLFAMTPENDNLFPEVARRMSLFHNINETYARALELGMISIIEKRGKKAPSPSVPLTSWEVLQGFMAFRVILSVVSMAGASAENLFGEESLLSMVAQGDTKLFVVNEKQELECLVDMLIRVMDTNAKIAVDFVKKRVRNNMENWLKEGIKGAEQLVAVMVPRLRSGGNKKQQHNGADVDFF